MDSALSEHCFPVACRLYDNVLVGTVNFNALTSCGNDFRLRLGTGYETASSYQWDYVTANNEEKTLPAVTPRAMQDRSCSYCRRSSATRESQ